MLYVDRDRAWLRSRKGNEMRRFDSLSQQIHSLLKGQRAILDGEIVVLDEQGRSIFADLMMGRGEAVTAPLTWCGSMAATCARSLC